jgi:putative kinase
MQQLDIYFPKSLLVTDQEIDISFLDEKQKRFYIDLFQNLVDQYRTAGKPRIIAGFAGPIGSGKSTIAALFRNFAGQIQLPFRFETLGIDAFHYPNEYLLAHETGGGTLKDIKGRYDTYDVDKLVGTLRDFTEGNPVSLPVYSRKTHDPVENAVRVTEENALLLLEGQWLLYDQYGWEKILPYLTHTYFVDAEGGKLRDAVIARHVRGGRSEEDAARYYDEVDAEDFELVMSTKKRAQKIIPSYFGI